MLSTVIAKLAALSIPAKALTGLAVAATSMAGATAAGVLPEPVQERSEAVIESVTPIEFPDHADFGQDVANDARDGGVDGQEISERARELGNQPEDPGQQDATHRSENAPAQAPGMPTDLPLPSALPTTDQVVPQDDSAAENAPEGVPTSKPTSPPVPESAPGEAPGNLDDPSGHG